MHVKRRSRRAVHDGAFTGYPSLPIMFKHILLATDGSPASDNAARLAVDLARTHGALLTALYVAEPYPYLNVGEASAVGVQVHMAETARSASRAHAQVAEHCATPGAPVTLRARRCEDASASDGILKAARDDDADLIVVGSHGRSGIPRLMLGSVAASVVAQSSLPVLVAR